MSRPWLHLPVKEPKEFNPGTKFFYEQIANPLIVDTIRIMNNGIPIDIEEVDKIEEELDKVLAKVDNIVVNNKYIKEFRELQSVSIQYKLTKSYKSKMRDYTYYLKEYSPTNMIHRSYVVRQLIGIVKTKSEVAKDVPKWSIKDIRDYSKIDSKVLKYLTSDGKEGMLELAKDKAKLYNKSYYGKIAGISKEDIYPKFNIGSSKQKRDLFEHLGVEAVEFSKTTGFPSWGKDALKSIKAISSDIDLIELLEAFLEYSAGAIIKNTFIPAFQNNTVDGLLHGNYKLLGALSGRYTSQGPNLMNMPSTGSPYAKPIKKCFKAPKGFLVYAVDFEALESRIIASITKDKNKCNIFLKGLDEHSLNAIGFFRDEIAQYMDLTGNIDIDTKEFYRLVEGGNKELKAIRQKGKKVSFGISYGAYPPKIAKTLDISIEDATKLFNNYHKVLYPSITEFKGSYVLPTANSKGTIHLGLGFSLASYDVERNSRTLMNANFQFWSMLTYIATNELHYRVDKEGYQSDIILNATIYDSIYVTVRKDTKIIKWLNDNIIEIMTKDFLENQIVKNEAIGELGTDWYNLKQLPNNATELKIKEIMC